MSTTVAAAGPVFPDASQVPASFRQSYFEAGFYLCDGEIRPWSGQQQEVTSPICIRNEQGPERLRLGHYPLLTSEAALEALEAAVRAWDRGHGLWPRMSVADRIRHMEAFIPRMLAVREQVVRLLMWEIGKTWEDSCREFDRTVEYIRETITAVKDLDRNSSRLAVERGFIAQIRRSPLGVVLCMGPQNYPLNETYTTLIPALIMGNTVVFKPPRYGVLLHAPLLSAFAESFPPGVVNTVAGEGPVVVGPMIAHGQVDVLAFIGSARVAALLKHQHPRPNRLRCVFGLEAKNPAVILPDADLQLAVRECILGALSFNGQRCTAIKIIFVHRSVAAPFVEHFATSVENLKVGMPWEEGVFITPLAEEGRPAFFRELVEEAVAAGARVVNRGGATIDGTLFYPAVLYPAALETRICRIEQFGPVTPIVPYDHEQEVIDWVTASPYGQQAALFGGDPRRLSTLIDALANQVCRININSQCQRGPDTFPFVGRKDSAENTLSVSDALRVFSIRSMVAARSTPANQAIVSAIVTGRHSKFLSTDFIF